MSCERQTASIDQKLHTKQYPDDKPIGRRHGKRIWRFKIKSETRRISAGKTMIGACDDLFSNDNAWLSEFEEI